jgi:hypothetical protein
LAETDGGPALGLQNPASDNLGSPPAGALWAVPDQYRDCISLFTYASPRPPEAVNVTISPPAGLYGGPVQVSFTTLNPSDGVRYRLGTNAIWAINLDGSGETYITTGARPRVSRDGQWLAFLREGNPFNNQGNLWVRHLASGQESRLFVSNPNPQANTNTLICYDWDLTETNRVFDYDNLFWQLRLDGSVSQFPIGSNYNQGAPAVSPVDGRGAFMSLYPGNAAIFLTPADLSSEQLLLSYPYGPREPAWSPDDQCFAFADGFVSPLVDGGRNLWVADLASSNAALFQITAFTDNTSGFLHGAQWAPSGEALVGAGSIHGTNGIWVIPLNADCMCSDGPLVLLPTSPGDPIDFVGSIVAASAPQSVVAPGLFIRLDPDAAVIYWSAAYLGFTLETTMDLSPLITWTVLPGPYAFDSYFYSYSVPLAGLLDKQSFRLHYTGAPR